MSVRPKDRKPTDLAFRQEDKIRTNLSNIIDNMNNNNLVHFYPKDESLFKKRIDKLNLKFYIETEKYLTNKNDMERCQDQLFIILFKQISLYIEEVERLNYLLKEKIEDEKSFKEKIEEMQKREREKSATQVLMNNLRASNKALEKKLEEKTKYAERVKSENESLNRQIKFYQEQLQIDLRKSHDIYKKKRNLEEYMNTSILNSNDTNTNAATNVGSTSNTSHTNNLIADIDVNSNNTNFNSNSTNSNVNININAVQSGNTSTPSTVNTIVNLNNINNYNHGTTITTKNHKTKNLNENLTLSKILNKKRNYSDNNPNQVKKGVNIVSVSINNRYQDQVSNTGTGFFNQGNGVNININPGVNSNAHGLSPNNIGPEGEKMKREITKSSIVHKNVTMNIKSPQRSEDISQNNIPAGKKPASDSKGMYKQTSKTYKDFKIIKSIKQQNKKTDSQDKTNDNKILNSPKGCSKFINLNYDAGMFNLNNTNANTSSSSSIQNENVLQDQIMTTFNSFDDEIAYLVELERALKNTKLLFTSTSTTTEREARPLINVESGSGLEEIFKRSESVEYNHGAIVFSDEENDGYKSGASCLSDKQYNFKNKVESKKTVTATATTRTGGSKPYPSVTIDLNKGGMGRPTHSKKKKEMVSLLKNKLIK